MDLTKFYNLTQNKDKSFKDFMDFLHFMFDNRHYSKAIKEESDRDNFDYHFNKIPQYTHEMFTKLDHELSTHISTTHIGLARISDKLEQFRRGE